MKIRGAPKEKPRNITNYNSPEKKLRFCYFRGKFWGCFREVWGTFWDVFGEVWGECLRVFSGEFREVLGGFLEEIYL